MKRILNITAVLTTGLFLQACAPAGNGEAANESWWRVTPVDIATYGEDSGSVSSSSTVTAKDPMVMNPTPEAPTEPTVAAYRMVDPYTRTRQTSLDPKAQGLVNEGEKYQIFSTHKEGRVALFSCVSGQADFFTSIDDKCEGHVMLGQLGYLNAEASAETPRAIYRCFGRFGHMDAANVAECLNSGLVADGVLGYAK